MLSAPQVIEEVNSRFIPVRVNLSTDGYPSNIPALKRFPRDYLCYECNLKALAAVDVFSPGGAHLLGTTGNTVLDGKTTAEFSFGDGPGSLLAFLEKCQARQQAVTAVLQDADKDAKTKAKELAELERETLRPILDRRNGRAAVR